MRVKLSALMAMSVAAFGIDENSLFAMPVFAIFAIFAFLADSETSRTKKPQQSRYEQIELTTGIGWGSKREELRAHLLGVWEPRFVTRPAQETTSAGSIKNWEMAAHVCLVGGAIGAFFFWGAPVAGFVGAAIIQYRITLRWRWGSAMLLNAIASIVALAFYFSPLMLVMIPAAAIFARVGENHGLSIAGPTES